MLSPLSNKSATMRARLEKRKKRNERANGGTESCFHPPCLGPTEDRLDLPAGAGNGKGAPAEPTTARERSNNVFHSLPQRTFEFELRSAFKVPLSSLNPSRYKLHLSASHPP